MHYAGFFRGKYPASAIPAVRELQDFPLWGRSAHLLPARFALTDGTSAQIVLVVVLVVVLESVVFASTTRTRTVAALP
jgi:hypothetical protein